MKCKKCSEFKKTITEISKVIVSVGELSEIDKLKKLVLIIRGW